MIPIPPKFVAALAAVAALGSTAGLSTASAHTQPNPAIHATAAKSCSAGYTRGVINGSVKCLRRGEYCTHSADRQYRHYGFRCIRWYAGAYRLT